MEKEVNEKKQTRHFYAVETYLGFPILDYSGNPDLAVADKKSDIVNLVQSSIGAKYISGMQALSLGKRTNWRPEHIIDKLSSISCEIKKVILDFRKKNRLTCAIKPFLQWKFDGTEYRYPLAYPLSCKNVLLTLKNYSDFLVDKRPASLPKVEIEVDITAAHNLKDYSDGNDCEHEYKFFDMDIKKLKI